MTQNFLTELSCQWQGQLSDYITDLVCSPAHQYWAASSAAGEVVLIDRSGSIVWLLPANGRSILTLGWSSDGRWLSAGGESGQVMLWDCQVGRELDGKPQLQQIFNTPGWVEQMTWHPTQSYIAVSSRQQVEIFDASTGDRIAGLTFDRSSVFDLGWHPSGEHLAVAGYKGIQIWSRSDWAAPPITLPVATASIHLAWSPNGRYLAAGNLDRTLGIWDFQDPADPWILQGCPGKIRQLVWSINPHSHNPLLAVATGTDIVLWQLAQADPSLGWEGELLTGHQAPVSAIAIHPHHLALAAADLDGYVCLWTPTGVVLQILEGTNTFSGFTTLAWNSEGSCLATGDGNGQLVVWCVSE